MRENFKRGFTLSEALIVMSIIGVVAAFSIPQVGYNIQKSRNASVLASAVKQVESGCGNVVSYYNSELDTGSTYEGYTSIKVNGNNLSGDLLLSGNKGLFNISSVTSMQRAGYIPKNYNKTTNMTTGYSMYTQLYALTGSGAWIGMGETITTDTNTDPISDIVFIDVNGKTKPNNLGRDIFLFGLTDRCKMIPAGSARMRVVGYPLSVNDVCTTTAQGTGIACADLIVRDGYKINY